MEGPTGLDAYSESGLATPPPQLEEQRERRGQFCFYRPGTVRQEGPWQDLVQSQGLLSSFEVKVMVAWPCSGPFPKTIST